MSCSKRTVVVVMVACCAWERVLRRGGYFTGGREGEEPVLLGIGLWLLLSVSLLLLSLCLCGGTPSRTKVDTYSLDEDDSIAMLHDQAGSQEQVGTV